MVKSSPFSGFPIDPVPCVMPFGPPPVFHDWFDFFSLPWFGDASNGKVMLSNALPRLLNLFCKHLFEVPGKCRQKF